jgi:MYXO-CTERM domain-containing protein
MSFHCRVLSFALVAVTCLAAVPANAGNWIGYMNVFDNSAGSKGAFVFGTSWGISDLKTTVITSNPDTIIGDSLRLQPNFNTYTDNPGDSFWRDNAGAGPGGNKWMEANTFVETNPLTVTSFTLQGTVDANDLDTNLYTAEAFIKVLDPNASFATVLNDRITLPTAGPFVVTSDLSLYQGMILQAGFTMNGLNANVVNEAAYGSVSVSVVPEPSTLGLAAVGLIGVLGSIGIRRRRKAHGANTTSADHI